MSTWSRFPAPYHRHSVLSLIFWDETTSATGKCRCQSAPLIPDDFYDFRELSLSTTSTTAHSIILSFTAFEGESRALEQREERKKLIFSYKDKIQCFALWLRFRILFPASKIKRREPSAFFGWSKCTRHATEWNHRGVSDSRDFIRFFSFPNYFLSISLKPCIKPLTWCDSKTGDGEIPFEMCSTIKRKEFHRTLKPLAFCKKILWIFACWSFKVAEKYFLEACFSFFEAHPIAVEHICPKMLWKLA